MTDFMLVNDAVDYYLIMYDRMIKEMATVMTNDYSEDDKQIILERFSQLKVNVSSAISSIYSGARD